MRQVIQYEIATSKMLGYNLGLKLVRGAYMNEERKLAKENGLESPVWDSIEETHACYNDCMKMAIDNVSTNSMVFVASHNQTTIELAKKQIREQGYTNDRVRFGQLKAFSDQLTN